MIEGTHGAPLARRLLREHRRVLWPLAAAIVANLLVYAFVVYPMSRRVATVEQRTRAAEQALAVARQEHARASGALTGKGQAAEELTTFYESILPRDLRAARRLTAPLWERAEGAGLQVRAMPYTPVPQRGSTLARLRFDLDLRGSYADVRSFIHQVETAPEFVIIDNLRLGEGTDESGWLQLRLEMSTYYRDLSP